MKKPVYLGLLTLQISKVVMHDEKARLGYMDTDSFIVHVETGNIYEDIANDIEKRFDTSSYSRVPNNRTGPFDRTEWG